MDLRDRAMANPGRPMTERSHNICHVSTLYRWMARQRREGHYEPREQGAWARGRLASLSVLGVYSLFWLVANYPQASRREKVDWIWYSTGVTVTPEQVSAEQKRMGITTKKMQYWSGRRNEQQRVDYWTRGPMDGAAGVVPGVHGERNVAGIAGVPVEMLIDIDEASYYVQDALRTRGSAPRGCPAVARGWGRRDGNKITVLCAVDVNVGTVASWTFIGNTGACSPEAP